MASGRRALVDDTAGAGRVRDPFPSTSDPAEYVPRAATEAALEALEAALEASEGPLALTGPPRLGKTLLARVLAGRLERRFESAHLAYSALPPEPLCAWALEQLGHEPGANPEAALVDRARRSAAEGRPVLLIVDDGAALPLSTARGLSDLAAVARGALRLLVVASDQSGVPGVLAGLGPDLQEIRLTQPMSAEETVRYVQARLGESAVPESVRARFDREELFRLHRDSCGVPGNLHRLADRVVLRGGWLKLGLPAPRAAPPPPREPRLELEGGALEGADLDGSRERGEPMRVGPASGPPGAGADGAGPGPLRRSRPATREGEGLIDRNAVKRRQGGGPWARVLLLALLALLAGMLVGVAVAWL